MPLFFCSPFATEPVYCSENDGVDGEDWNTASYLVAFRILYRCILRISVVCFEAPNGAHEDEAEETAVRDQEVQLIRKSKAIYRYS